MTVWSQNPINYSYLFNLHYVDWSLEDEGTENKDALVSLRKRL